jgi:DNA repair protein RadC
MAVQLPLDGAYAPPRLQTLPVRERPVSRLAVVGPGAVSSYELLAAVLRGPRQIEKAIQVLAGFDGDLTALSQASVAQLTRQGLSEQAAASLVAAFELGRRAATPQDDRLQVESPADAASLLMPKMAHLEQEHFWVVYLNTRNRVLGDEPVYKGSLNQTSIRIGDVFREAVQRNCAAIITAHNHPSGDPTPSPEDVAITRNLVQAGQLLDIEVLDHLIISLGRWISLRERGLGFADG